MMPKRHQKTLATFLIVIGLVFTCATTSSGQETQEDECTGEYQGKKIPPEVLSTILEEHAVWVLTEEVKGKRANLCGADLSKTTLSGANLFEANLRGAELIEAFLTGANLREAKLPAYPVDTTNHKG